jgi:8-oxo-dGTP pyrophosphatase MutT (NUDIX family)
MKATTLFYPLKDGRVLLAMKKRGFGVGKWNWPGGKVQPGESAEDACRRETLEETGIQVGVLEDRGVITFLFPDHPNWDNECRIYVTKDIIGEPLETEEMRPQWFVVADVPYADMWDDDPHWLPQVLAGGRVQATGTFDAEGHLVAWEADEKGDLTG